eukprot:scaffold116584_cov65-Phaeocystis_antarctica.AAC.5
MASVKLKKVACVKLKLETRISSGGETPGEINNPSPPGSVTELSTSTVGGRGGGGGGGFHPCLTIPPRARFAASTKCICAHEMHLHVNQCLDRSLDRQGNDASRRAAALGAEQRACRPRGARWASLAGLVPICTSYTLVDLTPKYLALVSLLYLPPDGTRVAAHRPPSTLSTVACGGHQGQDKVRRFIKSRIYTVL